ncbi:MAG: radical SAM family heme chaperone HemW [Gammaproteobacteria bacterium]
MIPLSLYVHFPWCVKKCPYCDFNSHTLRQDLPEATYIEALFNDLRLDLERFSLNRPKIQSIFLGGGTPSLFSPQALAQLLSGLSQQLDFTEDIEITLEANPGTVEQSRFVGYKAAGINRISLGIQSFQPEKLTALGRIHSGAEATAAIQAAQRAGFDNINVDLMYGLPDQSTTDALYDLKTAIACEIAHLSWYQLTLEPNTLFHHRPPDRLPSSDLLWDIQEAGLACLEQAGFTPYEISAYTQRQAFRPSRHNLNYWQFGDYLGIGAGAHGKLTQQGSIWRYWKTRHPQDYLNPARSFMGEAKILAQEEIPFEFMLNHLRLYQPLAIELFQQRCGIQIEHIQPMLNAAKCKMLLDWDEQFIYTTELGKRHLNDLMGMFLV